MVFGPGRVAELAAQVRRVGGSRALVVTDPGITQTPILSAVLAALEAGGVQHAVFSDVHPNPVEADVFAGAEAYRQASADCVVAVGGGSPLDAGKIIRLLATHQPPLEQYDDAKGGDANIRPDVPPMVAIPTTAGTGSEVGRSGVVVLESTGLKTVIFHPCLMPNVALCDPELTVGLPPFLTAATGIDALTHCIEAYLATGYHPFADSIALGGMELVRDFLPRAVETGADIEARSQMMVAAAMGATAFQKGLGVCHSLAHPLSTVAGIHHGHANAMMLPEVLRFNAETVPDKVERIGWLLGDPEGDAGQAVLDLVHAVGLPASLGEAGVAEERLPELVAQAKVDACQATNPRPASTEDLEALYRACW